MPSFESSLKILTLIGAVVTFAWGVFQYIETQRQQSETRRIEATKPFLERQLKLYTEATQIASTIATTGNAKTKAEAQDRFWSLYWGELALVEDAAVETAMVRFGEALRSGSPEGATRQRALELAHACRGSLARSWGVAAWQSPHEGRKE